MLTVTVNDKEVEIDPGSTVLHACEAAGEEIPRFCYHERLHIAGNCRMCLVQIEGGPPKPAASCAMPAADGMKIHTNTPMVKKAREGVMEFLLINHPLDCPICDQGGECDLQDQAMTYGLGTKRFDENKRAVKDKYMGPLIKTQMTRCIQCTRCVRFIDDVAGISELGAVYRGEDMEISTYVEKSLTSELSGNIIDLCPVGALTSKPYAFKARPWELRKTETIDVLDAVGSNIRVDVRGREVMRILPRLNEDINEEWLADKSRFSYDGLKMQRLDQCFVRKGGSLKPATWEEAFTAIAKKVKKAKATNIAALAGDLADVESMFLLKALMEKLGSPHIDCRQDGTTLDASNRSGYLFNTSIAGIEEADLCLLIGTNPRKEAPILNARIRKRYLSGQLDIALIGEEEDLTYDYEALGNEPEILEKIASGKHPFFKKLQKAKKPMLILGSGALTRSDSQSILGLASDIAEKYGLISDKWNGFNVLHTAASRVGGLDIGFVPKTKGKSTNDIIKAASKDELDILYLLGADEIDMSQLGKTFVIYQGHHGDAGAHRADVILPGAAYTEKAATYVNTEGRVQRTRKATFLPGQAKEDWKIIRALSDALEQPLPYDSLKDIRKALENTGKHFAAVNEIIPTDGWKKVGRKGKLTKAAFANVIDNYYLTNPISRASKTMAQCSSNFNKKDEKAAA